MDQFYKKCEEDRRAIELENTKLKLRMVSRNSKSSKPSVDDYINNILGSGLKFNKPIQKCESQSAKNIYCNDSIYTQNNLNQSCNLQSQIQNGNKYHTEHYMKLPTLYHDVIDVVRLPAGDLDTSKIYNIFITSGLSQEILGTIWSLINRTSPGQLTQQELVAGLAMIAMCQDQVTSHGPHPANVRWPTWDQVLSLHDLPVPRIVLSRPTDVNESKPIGPRSSDPVAVPSQQEGIDEWADFSGFDSGDTKSQDLSDNQLGKVDTSSSDLKLTHTHPSPVTTVHHIDHPVIDIRQEIDNQFSNWRENIQSDKILSSAALHSDVKYQTPNNDNENSHEVSNSNRKSTSSVVPTMIDADFGDFQLFSTTRSVVAFEDVDNRSKDRYEIFHCEEKGPSGSLIDQWLRCLAQCLRILSTTVSVLKQVEDEMVKIDVFNSEKGVLLLKGIIEVYRVTRNIKLSASRANILTSSKPMLDHLSDLETRWNEFMLIIPDEMQIDVHSKLSRGGQDSITIECSDDAYICGVCLSRLDHDEGFLCHGLHRYHCPCANLWVNTLDLTLPGLSVPLASVL